MIITPEENELLLELAAQFDYPEYAPEKHITRKQMAQTWGISENGASYRLEKLVQNGVLEVETVLLPDGNKCKGYYRA